MYVNDLGEEGEERVRAAYGQTDDRLVGDRTWGDRFRVAAGVTWSAGHGPGARPPAADDIMLQPVRGAPPPDVFPVLILAVLLLAACATARQGDASLDAAANTTDTADFTVTAQPGTWRNQPQVEGYVRNKRDFPATRILLRVEAVDGTGKVLTSAIRHLDQKIPANDRVFYQVPPPGPAPAYRVYVDYVFWGGGGGGSGGGGGGM